MRATSSVPGRKRSTFKALTCAAAALAMSATGLTVASAAGSTPGLVVSAKADRSGAHALGDTPLTGNQYFFFDGPTDVLEVKFFIDDVAQADEKIRPFDLASTAADGTANPFNVSSLAPGSHKVKYIVYKHDHSYTNSIAFTVGKPTTTTTAKPTTTTQAPPAFVHPGIVNSKAQLDWVKAQLSAGAEPQTSAMNTAKYSGAGNLSRTPSPVAYVGCGSSWNPDEGCSAEAGDWAAAYTQALMWYYTGNTTARDSSIRILNAWGYTLKGYKHDDTYKGGPLQAAWAAEGWTKAAEIMRYSNSGWKAADIAQFEKMLKTTSLPLIENGVTGSSAINWGLSMSEGVMNIGVFTNDMTLFNKGVSMWKSNTKSAIYLTTDGSTPIIPAGSSIQPSWMNHYWYDTNFYANGQSEELCRDMGHVALGMAAMFNAAETAYIQHVDLYAAEKTRITTGMEYTTRFLNNRSASGWPCPSSLVMGDNASKMTWEIGYNHYHNILGVSLPQTKQWISGNRPTRSELQITFETLTHGRPLS